MDDTAQNGTAIDAKDSFESEYKALSIPKDKQRVRLNKEAVRILESFENTGLPPSQIVENALQVVSCRGDLNMSTLGDLNGAILMLNSTLETLTVSILEVYKTMIQVEGLLEKQMLIAPLEQALQEFRDKQINGSEHKPEPKTAMSAPKL